MKFTDIIFSVWVSYSTTERTKKISLFLGDANGIDVSCDVGMEECLQLRDWSHGLTTCTVDLWLGIGLGLAYGLWLILGLGYEYCA